MAFLWAPLLRGRTPNWIFHNLGSLLQPLEFVPESRKHAVPTEWQIRTVLGDCMSRTRILSIQASQYRQHALISDFLDLALLSLQQEASLATKCIKDRREGIKLQNIVLATMTGPAMSSSPKNMNADVKSLGSGKRLILHGFECCVILQGTLGGNFDIIAASGESIT